MDQSTEIELKLRLADKASLQQKLKQAGAEFVSTFEQTDILFVTPFIDFKKLDQALRLRIQKSDRQERHILTFKGTPSFTPEGHKVRDEFETAVEHGEAIQNILSALNFTEGARIQKIRESYRLMGIAVEIDQLKFGTFVELEGSSENIELVRQKLGLQDAEPVKESYIALQRLWEAQAS